MTWSNRAIIIVIICQLVCYLEQTMLLLSVTVFYKACICECIACLLVCWMSKEEHLMQNLGQMSYLRYTNASGLGVAHIITWQICSEAPFQQ